MTYQKSSADGKNREVAWRLGNRTLLLPIGSSDALYGSIRITRSPDPAQNLRFDPENEAGRLMVISQMTVENVDIHLFEGITQAVYLFE